MRNEFLPFRCIFLTINATFMGCSLVAYRKMNNIRDDEGEANGGVFVGDSIVLISSLGFPAQPQLKTFNPQFKISYENPWVII